MAKQGALFWSFRGEWCRCVLFVFLIHGVCFAETVPENSIDSTFPQALGNVEQTGYKDVLPVLKPKLKWMTSLPEKVDDHQWVHPALGSGDRDLYLIGSYNLYRIKAETGEIAYKKKDKFLALATIFKEMLFSTTENTLEAWDVLSSSEPVKKWEYKTVSLIQSDSKYCLYDISPTVFEDMVLFGYGRESLGPTHLDTHLYAVNAKTGQEIWKLDTQCMIESAVTIDPKRKLGFFVTSFPKDSEFKGAKPKRYAELGLDKKPFPKGFLIAVDLKTGKEKWKIEHDQCHQTGPAYSDDRIYASNRTDIFCLDPETGKDVWRVKREALVDIKPHDIVFFGCHNTLVTPNLVLLIYRNTLEAHHKKDGSLAWKVTTKMKKGVMGFIYAAQNVVYVPEYDPEGSLFAYHLEDGKELWSYKVPPVDAGESKNGFRYLSFVNKRIYFGDYNSRIYCLEDDVKDVSGNSGGSSER